MYQYPFEPKKIMVGNHTISCLDEGQGETLVMVHGNPSWSYLYRNLVSDLRDSYRCIVPDHLGCGLSDKPQEYPYRLENHIDNLEFVLDSLQVEKCVLIVHDWGGAIGMGWAGRHPERIKGIVVLNTAAFPSRHIPLRIAVCRWPVLGPLLVRGLNGFVRASVFMAVSAGMDKRVAAGFTAPYNDWHNRVAVNGFVRDIPMNEQHPSWNSLEKVEAGLDKLTDKPMLIFWGGQDFCFNREFYEQWQHRFPEASSHYFEKGNHYVLEDCLPEAKQIIYPFIGRCYGRL
jgi:haloalkane dehalogenase